jgi:beta-lactam-binding protein with PASTA domain
VAKGSKVRPGTVVNLIVSKGFVEKVKTPVVLRKSLAEAREILAAAGLKLGNVTKTTKYEKEIILKQDPPPFKMVIRGSAVDVEVTAKR